jgi:hypothetical protein
MTTRKMIITAGLLAAVAGVAWAVSVAASRSAAEAQARTRDEQRAAARALAALPRVWTMPVVEPKGDASRTPVVVPRALARTPEIDPVLRVRGIGFGEGAPVLGRQPSGPAPQATPSQPAPSQPAPSQPAAPPAGGGGGGAKPKSLDELLGIKPKAPPAPSPGGAGAGGGGAGGGGAPARPGSEQAIEELDRTLKGESIEDNFEAAVDLMSRSALRLNQREDAGLDTQRLQQDALRKLEGLISQFQKQRDNSQSQSQSESSSSSQSQSQQSKQQQPQNASQEQDQQQSGAASQRAQRDRSSDSNENAQAPARRDAVLRPGLEAAKAAWGALPARVREMLLQGSGEKFSQSYEQLTEEYYKRLAEQKP